MDSKPVIAKWELWSLANMLVSVHGDEAERHAQSKLAQALEDQDEGGEIVWQGVITQLERIRATPGKK